MKKKLICLNQSSEAVTIYFQYINGQKVTTHEIGHLPFEVDITKNVKQRTNLVTVVVDNTLTGTTIPQGSHQKLPG